MKKNKYNVDELIKLLKKAHPEATCSLNFNTPFEAVVSVILSAQCTDERVNKTTPALFARCKTIEDYSNISTKDLEKLIYPCGFYKNKAENIKKCAKQVLEKFGGVVPKTMDELISLAGVGRKTANVIMLEVFNNPVGIAVDTHAKRVSNRIGLSKQTSPEKIEQDLLKIFPKKYLKDINHLFVYHGRKICDSRNPKCEICNINHLCDMYLKKHK